MFSDIQNIGSALEPLKAEAVDSRLNKKNQEHGEGKKSRGKSDDNAHSNQVPAHDASGTDSAEKSPVTEAKEDVNVNRFSVDSLIFYLEDFLEEHIVSQTPNKSDAADFSDVTQEDSTPHTSIMAPWLRSKHTNSNQRKMISSAVEGSEDPRNVVVPRYAAHAYAHRALSNEISAGARNKVRRHITYDPKTGTSSSSEHDPKIGDIYNLISDLRTMKANGATHLDVKDDAALVEGIGAAIRRMDCFS